MRKILLVMGKDEKKNNNIKRHSNTISGKKEYLFDILFFSSILGRIIIDSHINVVDEPSIQIYTWLYSVGEGSWSIWCDARMLRAILCACGHWVSIITIWKKMKKSNTHELGPYTRPIDANQQIRLHSAHLIVWKSFWYIVIVCLVIRYAVCCACTLAQWFTSSSHSNFSYEHTHLSNCCTMYNVHTDRCITFITRFDGSSSQNYHTAWPHACVCMCLCLFHNNEWELNRIEANNNREI